MIPDPNLVVEALRELSIWSTPGDSAHEDQTEYGAMKRAAKAALPHAKAIAEELSARREAEAIARDLGEDAPAIQELIAALDNATGLLESFNLNGVPMKTAFPELWAALAKARGETS
jgi:hypothetical protein